MKQQYVGRDTSKETSDKKSQMENNCREIVRSTSLKMFQEATQVEIIFTSLKIPRTTVQFFNRSIYWFSLHTDDR